MNAPGPQRVESEGDGLRLGDYLPYRLAVASSAVSRLIARAYEDRFGLTIPQWRVICVLAEEGTTTLGSLVARTGMDKLTIGRAAKGLSRRHLTARDGPAGDGPSQAFVLTLEGRRLYEEIAPLALAYEAALVAGLAPAEVALLKRLLGRLQTAAGALVGEAAAA